MSLLDKWEIGSLLTDVLIFDAFTALKIAKDNHPDGGDDVCSTWSLYLPSERLHSYQ